METSQHEPGSAAHARASSRTVTLALIGLTILFTAIFLIGYLPRRAQTAEVQAAADEQVSALPVVTVAVAERGPQTMKLELPGNIQAITEAPILARAEGYLVKRYADIGDRVKAGQLLAEIDAPDLDQQVRQAEASALQAEAALSQAQATLQQSEANLRLAEVTAKRNDTLVGKGVLSKQEGDQSTATYQAQTANVQAARANINAARQSMQAAEANLGRLRDLQSYKKVRAPYNGVITLRNIDTGALITNGATMLFRIAQADLLRIFINVPQANYNDLKLGAAADIDVRELPGRKFTGQISRISGAIDTNTRTMLTEIQIPNRDHVLLPGMYAQVRLAITRRKPPLVVPGETVVTRANGIFVAVVRPDDRIHFSQVQLGRDYGLEVEILDGLSEGDRVVVSPSDDVREGAQVKTAPFKAPSTGNPAAKKALS